MPFSSDFPRIDIPKCNILSYLFPQDQPVSTEPQWMEATDPSISLSMAQMLSWIKRFAVGLDKLGIPKSRAVMVFTPNHLYVPMVYLSAAGSGRYFTGANPGYNAKEVAYQMKNIDAAIVLIHPALLDTGLAAAKEAGIPHDRVFQFSIDKSATTKGIKDWRSFIVTESEAKDWKWDSMLGDPATKNIAAINFSSGTTGLPKGVCITHHNLISNASQAISARYAGTPYANSNTTPPECWLGFLPLYHAYSQLWTINIAAKLKIPVYVMASFVFDKFLENIQRYKITALQAVPPVCVMLSKRPETKNYDISSLKHVMVGAAPMSSDLQNEVSRRFNLVIVQGWGMTETTCAGIMTPGYVNDQTGSIGYLMPNTEAKLIDEDGKEVTKPEEPGELWVRGPQMLLSYWRNEEATRESKTPDGWFKTGDVAIYRETEHPVEKGSGKKTVKFWIVDRKKELIKVNGLQVAPAELEAVLLEHEAVADAAAVGIIVHDEELPCAYVVLQQDFKGKVGEKDIQDFVAGKVAKHKRLTGGVRFIDEVPKLASGKIVRKLMKEWAKRDAKEAETKVRPRL